MISQQLSSLIAFTICFPLEASVTKFGST